MKELPVKDTDTPATPADSVETLRAENTILREQVESLKTAQAVASDDARFIAGRIAKGLSRSQAVKVLQRQKQFHLQEPRRYPAPHA